MTTIIRHYRTGAIRQITNRTEKPMVPLSPGSRVRRWMHIDSHLSVNSKLDKPQVNTESPRINPFGIQYLSKNLRDQLFKETTNKDNSMSAYQLKENKFLHNMALKSLQNHNLYGKKTSINTPINMNLPTLQGQSLDEHFQKIGNYMAEPYLSMAKTKFKDVLPKPKKWEMGNGKWIRYAPNSEPETVEYPLENLLVFDVETLPKISQYPILATALSEKAWYSWTSPFLTKDINDNTKNFEHLIPLNTQDPSNAKVIIGHNVSYDRARVLEEYNFKPSNAFFLDTLSLHLGTSGMCSRQRNYWKNANKILKLKKEEKDRLAENEEGEEGEQYVDTEDGSVPPLTDADDVLENDPWVKLTTLNSLKECALFYCGIKLNKDTRDIFVNSHEKKDVFDRFQELCDYCADDVVATSLVFDKVFSNFIHKMPHPVSFAALKMISQSCLPTNSSDWKKYIDSAESLYQISKIEIENKLINIVEDVVKLKDSPEVFLNDPWLKQLDWTCVPVKLTKKGVPYKNQKLPGFPAWYKALFPSASTEKPCITIKSRDVPIFFKLCWEKKPVVWSKTNGWCFEALDEKEAQHFRAMNYHVANDEKSVSESGDVFRVPHPNGAEFRTTTLLSKPFMHSFAMKTLSSTNPLAIEALEINASGSYWMSSRRRIMNQWVVPQRLFPKQFQFSSAEKNNGENPDVAMILPNILPMGTVTRRAVENCWLTASNAKKNRIGSELKSLVKAPKGYCFIGADVDSEELWIASLVGDSVFKMHGSTPIGWMCLEGTKNEGTDLHTKTAQILGCSRNEAKIFNYGRIYGAGLKFAGHLLKKFVPSITEKTAETTATSLYQQTKGGKVYDKDVGQFWYGGSESVLFNKLEEISNQDKPRTPVLGASITSSLLKENLKKNSFGPSRINWAIQSSGVDYLHLLCCSMNYLIDKYKIDARMMISIHDEIRFLVKEEDKYRAAMALQISNLWTRSMFCEQMGLADLPQSCAFFSAVDVDFVLRKEVDLDCITPSNKVAIPFGESLDIYKLMSTESSRLGDPDNTIDVSQYAFKPRPKEIENLSKDLDPLLKKYTTAAQVQNDKRVVGDLMAEYKRIKKQDKFMKEYSELLDETMDFNDPLRMQNSKVQDRLQNQILADDGRMLGKLADTTKVSSNIQAQKKKSRRLMDKHLKIPKKKATPSSALQKRASYSHFMASQSVKRQKEQFEEEEQKKNALHKSDADAINYILQNSLLADEVNQTPKASKATNSYDDLIKKQKQTIIPSNVHTHLGSGKNKLS